MKASALLLLVAFAGLQSVSVTDCPCGSLCETKNACPDESRHASPDDCCSRNQTSERNKNENCFHLEPQTELDSAVMEYCQAPALDLGMVDVPPVSLEHVLPCLYPAAVGPSPPARRRPLFLIHSALLI